MTISSKVRNIPLSQLVLSPANVRTTPATAAEDAALEASIRAKGILQNLIVHPVGGDCYEVDAGGRRFRILQKLAAEGVIDAGTKVPCKIEEPEAAVETSLAENTIRAAMHPADEFVAMAALIDGGATIETVAARFGTDERHVRQRLRLGRLAPELLDAYRAGKIGLEAVTAFTLGANHAAQLAVWSQLKDQSYISPHRVRHLLTESAIALDSDLGRFVGTEAYEAAAGRPVTRDLFSADDEGFMDDAALVRRLAIEKLEARAAELRPQWKWAKAVLDLEYGELARYARLRPQPADIPPDLASEIERIERRLGEIAAIAENDTADEFTDELAPEEAQLEERRAEIDDIIDRLAVYSDEHRVRAGCIVTIGENGDFCLHQGLVERTAARGSAATQDVEGIEAGDDDEAWTPDETGDDEPDGVQSSGARLSREQALRKELGFSQSLVDDLEAHRLQITRAHLAGNFEVAFDLALYTLGIDLLRHGYRSRPLDLKAIESRPRSSINDLAGTAADRLIDAHRHALDLDWLERPPAEGFAALTALPPAAKQRLFAWCIAATLNPQLSIEDRADPVIECAGQRLAIPFADYWRPTAANYWGRVKKAHGLAAGAEILGDRWARDHAAAKKPVLAAALETAFDPAKSNASVSLNQTARDSAAVWLPPGMAYEEAALFAHSLNSEADNDGRAEFDGDNAAEAESASTDLPAFLVEDEAATALNGAAAP
jgi:ParB family transcriptional regulator, chromosome partitioning protein